MRVTWSAAAMLLLGPPWFAGCEDQPARTLPPVVEAAGERVRAARCLLRLPDPVAGAAARAELTADLRRYVAGRPGRVVFAAHDLVTGVRLGQGEHEHDIITASGAKVDILTALMLRRPSLDAAEQDLASRMIRESDNLAADALWARVGAGEGMSAFYRRVGLRETVPGPGRYWGGTTTSPADRLRLLRLLVDGGEGLAPPARRTILGLMGRVQADQAWGVSAAARPHDRVALKNGWTARPFVHDTWAVTSYGRITGDGRDLLLSVQTDQQAGEGQGIQAIEGLARTIGRRLRLLTPFRAHTCPAGAAP
ncbi:serine hydrolase [Nonomuraea sp. NPDC050383]|uniref:serine hydrolase n=1 Tax=Nonomuraea sp. NPDC050383 TaxID=3364362 RepID=UPI0037A06A22